MYRKLQEHLIIVGEVGRLPAEGAHGLADVLVGDHDGEEVCGAVLAALVLAPRQLHHLGERGGAGAELAVLLQQRHRLRVVQSLLDHEPHLHMTRHDNTRLVGTRAVNEPLQSFTVPGSG